MIIKHLSQMIVNISFEKEDWDNGRASRTIEYLKSLPTGSKFYMPKEKLWRVNKLKAGEGFDQKLMELRISTNTVGSNDFDVDKWLEDTFDEMPEEVPEVKPIVYSDEDQII